MDDRAAAAWRQNEQAIDHSNAHASGWLGQAYNDNRYSDLRDPDYRPGAVHNCFADYHTERRRRGVFNLFIFCMLAGFIFGPLYFGNVIGAAGFTVACVLWLDRCLRKAGLP
jgi:hypothetical protein